MASNYTKYLLYANPWASFKIPSEKLRIAQQTTEDSTTNNNCILSITFSKTFSRKNHVECDGKYGTDLKNMIEMSGTGGRTAPQSAVNIKHIQQTQPSSENNGGTCTRSASEEKIANENNSNWSGVKFGERQPDSSKTISLLKKQRFRDNTSQDDGTHLPKPQPTKSPIKAVDCVDAGKHLSNARQSLGDKESLGPVFNPKDNTTRMKSRLYPGHSSTRTVSSSVARPLTNQGNFKPNAFRSTQGVLCEKDKEPHCFKTDMCSLPSLINQHKCEEEKNNARTHLIIPSISISTVGEDQANSKEVKPITNQELRLPDIHITTKWYFPVLTPTPLAQNRLAVPLVSEPPKAFMPPKRRLTRESLQTQCSRPKLDANCAALKEGKKEEQVDTCTCWLTPPNLLHSAYQKK